MNLRSSKLDRESDQARHRTGACGEVVVLAIWVERSLMDAATNVDGNLAIDPCGMYVVMTARASIPFVRLARNEQLFKNHP